MRNRPGLAEPPADRSLRACGRQLAFVDVGDRRASVQLCAELLSMALHHLAGSLDQHVKCVVAHGSGVLRPPALRPRRVHEKYHSSAGSRPCSRGLDAEAQHHGVMTMNVIDQCLTDAGARRWAPYS